MRMAHVVGVIMDVRIIAPVPSWTVDIIVVGVVIYHGSGCADKRIVWRHDPGEVGTHMCGAEAQVLRCTVYLAMLHQIDALQIDGHENLLACVGIVPI